MLPTSTGIVTVPLATSGSGPLLRGAPLAGPRRLVSSVKERTNAAPAPLAITPGPDKCAPDEIDGQMDCITFTSNIISVVSYTPANVLAPLKLVGQIETDAPASGVPFNDTPGTGCVICGVAYDPTDKAIVISTANGYELYSPAAAVSSPSKVTAPLTTTAAPISDNFGYDIATNQIFSPYYNYTSNWSAAPFSNLDVVNVAAGKGTWYDLLPADVPATMNEPDAGAIDTKTGIAISPEEGSVPVYLEALPVPGSAAYVAKTPTKGGPGGTYATSVAAITPSAATYNQVCDMTYVATDSVEDLAFFGDQYCSGDYIALAKLPSSSGAQLAFSSYVDAELPALPGGAGAFNAPLDPHAAVVVNLPGVCADCGLLFNYDKSYLAIVDLNKFLALAPASPNGYDVPLSTNLTTNGTVKYIATGVSSPPSAFLRARAAYRLTHPSIEGAKKRAP
jgi:hypothetical protein